MKARFLHFADCHLGYQQYGEKERFNDFARAFRSVIRTAIGERVDFVILAGDLFHKRAIDALTLNQAILILEQLRAAGILCIAVEGNHEQVYYRDHLGWMEFLAERDLLVLLHPPFQDGRPNLAPYTKNAKGAYIDPLPGLRVYGMRYQGASTARAVAGYAEALALQPADGVGYTIFVTHAGVEGVLPNHVGGLSHRELAPLRPYVDYLALGHIHKPFVHDDWIYNAGSLETCSLEEAGWTDRGYFLVDVDTDRPRQEGEPRHVARLGSNPRRPFHRLYLRVDMHPSPDALYPYCQQFIERRALDLAAGKAPPGQEPVVELRLNGALAFDRSSLNLSRLHELVIAAFQPLHCQIKDGTQPNEFAVEVDSSQSRSDLERKIVIDLLERDARFRSHSQAWADLALSLKNLALTGGSPEALLDELKDGAAAIKKAENED
jgi:DNA repair protein SbcD/Mre11